MENTNLQYNPFQVVLTIPTDLNVGSQNVCRTRKGIPRSCAIFVDKQICKHVHVLLEVATSRVIYYGDI